MTHPTLWIVAGPNGAGKSTIVSLLNDRPLPVVNPDVIAASLTNRSETERHLIAGRQALTEQGAFIKARQSFIVETTFSGQAGFRLLHKARDNGFQVNLTYMALRTFQQSIGRVHTRVLDGGHNVPVKDIVRRFDRVSTNINAAVKRVDFASIVDNTGLRPKLVACIKNGQVVRKDSALSDWLIKRLSLLQQS